MTSVMTDTGSAEADNGALQLRAVLEEHQQSQQSNLNALAETLGSTLTLRCLIEVGGGGVRINGGGGGGVGKIQKT